MTLPKMNTLRLDVLDTQAGTLTLLVDQETNGIYYTKMYHYTDKIRNVYKAFKYDLEEIRSFRFYVPYNLLDKVIQLNNGSQGSPLDYRLVFSTRPELIKNL